MSVLKRNILFLLVSQGATWLVTIFLLILFDPAPTWVDVLVYAMVAVTVISGIDYFFGLRRRIEEHEKSTTEA